MSRDERYETVKKKSAGVLTCSLIILSDTGYDLVVLFPTLNLSPPLLK